MNILYHQPSLDNIYAQRTIYEGYKDAFIELGHNFFVFTNADKNELEQIIVEYEIDILITKYHFYYNKGLDFDLLLKLRKKGLKVFNTILPVGDIDINTSLRDSSSSFINDEYIARVKDGYYGDFYYGYFENNDSRINKFTTRTNKNYYTIPLACNPKQQFYDYDECYKNDIAYLGSWSNNKELDFKELLYPLKDQGLNLYGQDWTIKDRFMGNVQRVGQYFNLPILAKIQKPKLPLNAERKIYSSTNINLNIHERPQKKYGGDCNERTFKILACGGFQIVDDVACIRKYFKDGEEIIIAKNKDDRFDKIKYYTKHPEQRIGIIEAGKKKVLAEHTYTNRVHTFLDIYNKII